MSKVMDRMKEIVSELPQDYFDNMDEYATVGALIDLYLKKYGEDETTLIPGTDTYMNHEYFKNLYDKLKKELGG